MRLSLTPNYSKKKSLQVRCIMEIWETSTFCQQLLLLQDTPIELKKYSALLQMCHNQIFISCLSKKEEKSIKFLSMTMSQFTRILEGLCFVKQMDNKYGPCFWRRLGPNSKDLTEPSKMAVLTRYYPLFVSGLAQAMT